MIFNVSVGIRGNKLDIYATASVSNVPQIPQNASKAVSYFIN